MKYIKVFQEENKLKVDGVIGIKTLTKMKQVFGIHTDEDMAHFMGQISHESLDFKFSRENLNYSEEMLSIIFKRYFPTKEYLKKYARKPRDIANRVYANRMGNGNESSGDGWKYRGCWSIQLTGKNNFIAFSNYMEDAKILDNPDEVIEEYYWWAAVFFFNHNKLFNLTDKVDYNTVKRLTRRVNGGYTHLKDRYNRTNRFYKILKKNSKIEYNEEQDTYSSGNHVDNNNTNILVREEEDAIKIGTHRTNGQKTEDKRECFSEIIRRVLQYFGGRYINKKTTK